MNILTKPKELFPLAGWNSNDLEPCMSLGIHLLQLPWHLDRTWGLFLGTHCFLLSTDSRGLQCGFPRACCLLDFLLSGTHGPYITLAFLKSNLSFLTAVRLPSFPWKLLPTPTIQNSSRWKAEWILALSWVFLVCLFVFGLFSLSQGSQMWVPFQCFKELDRNLDL